MEFLILTPPVVTPAEPPSGAFLLAAGLKGWGADVGFLNLSLEFYYDLFRDASDPVQAALNHLIDGNSPYDPMVHRSQAGHLHGLVSGFDARYPGWKLTLMDIAPPGRVHRPAQVAEALDRHGQEGPFRRVFRRVLAPVLSEVNPEKVLVSVAYLSQLPGAIDLVRFLESRGISPLVGGSLINSLATTGHGFEAVQAVLPRLMVGDGSGLLPKTGGAPLLSRLAYPTLLSDKPYLSRRPVLPLVLSTGCYWNKCLFCPDREMSYFAVPEAAVEQFVDSIPGPIRSTGPVLHLLDSAIPPGRLRRYLEVVDGEKLGFFGFARPTRHLLKGGLLSKAAEQGCLMLQLGVEGGSGALLDRFQKGIDPRESGAVVRAASEAGIRTYLYLLFGLPGEGAADLDATYDFIAGLGDHIDFLNLSLFNLPRYCELMDRRDAFDIELLDFPGEDGEIRLYRPFLVNGVDPRQQARRFLKRFRTHPLIREAYLRTPRWFRAAHLALMDVPGRRRSW